MIDSNELTRKIKTPLNPKAALIAYASENDRNFFLEIREIDDRGNMTEGRPVTLEFMNTLVKGYSERHSTTPYGKIPDKPVVLRPAQGKREIRVVQPSAQEDDVLQPRAQNRKRGILPAGSDL